ncbi:AAA family ATPase [Halocatena halophila]|uniref:AAA family ATPase n=1 Tax=Halocatena halophila TaxID=2814576 RepID=UPI002ED3A12A
MALETATEHATTVLESIQSAVICERRFLEELLVGFLGRGHVLLEDVPGTGKTLTARSFGTALGLSFSRIQFTPDLLPTDITGTELYNERTNEFEFRNGPLFANVVLADEINRAPPKTQSALLEAMAEGQVTVEGTTHQLPEPFFVIATQNPIEMDGTFGLPEAQLDRFAVKTSLGYPDFDGEVELLSRRLHRADRTPAVEQVLAEPTVQSIRTVPESVTVDPDLLEYVASICRGTREDSRVEVGVSPRGTQRLLELLRARAVVVGRSYVTPDDVRRLAEPVLSHRLVLTTDAMVDEVSRSAVIDGVFDRVAVPTV